MERHLRSVMTEARHVVLIGLMGSGKSTVGRPLAATLGRPFVDNDTRLEERTGQTAREVAAAEGADALHVREAEVLVEALASRVVAVVAAAAAAPMEANAAAAMRVHAVVYLRSSPEVLAARIERASVGDDHRPFVGADPLTVLSAQFAARDDRYQALAMLVVDADRPVDVIVDEISAALAR
jgi:shikimate kinase